MSLPFNNVIEYKQWCMNTPFVFYGVRHDAIVKDIETHLNMIWFLENTDDDINVDVTDTVKIINDLWKYVEEQYDQLVENIVLLRLQKEPEDVY